MQKNRILTAATFIIGISGIAFTAPEAAAATAPTAPSVAPAIPADEALTQQAIAFLTACVTRDADYVIAHSIDDPVGSFTGIGSGMGDKWTLKDTEEDLRGLKKVGWEDLDPKGFIVGDVAWFTDLAYGVLPDGQKIRIRISLIMRHTGPNEWKAVHFHVSEGKGHEGIAKQD